MNSIELLGWIATSITVASFIPKGEDRIRTINGIACIVWIIYGMLVKNNPIVVVNSIVLLLHTIFWIRMIPKKKTIMTQTEWNKERDKMAEQLKADPDYMYKWIKEKHKG